ncbi:hypothetical protein NVP1031O_032 [Vibrio phage 1.031.O._10N.261.46.F8]|nr:hypothetical protein NVP1031O_032 [Vibrio phage 1.031.O._10N.261.46.F8]CAH9017177.1 conserved hypothetical protein [Vibrio phage 150E35-1]
MVDKTQQTNCIEDIVIENAEKLVVSNSDLAYYGNIQFHRKTDAPINVGDKLVATVGGWLHDPA